MPVQRFKFTRKRILAFILIAIALGMLVLGNRSLTGEVVTILTLTEPGAVDALPSIVVPTLAYMNIISLFFLVVGVLALVDPAQLHRAINVLLIIAGILIIPTILIVAAAGNSTNITTMMAESVRLATPIAIGAMAGLWCERSGVVNIAIEGMMLFGACFGFTTLFFLQDVFPPDQIGIVMILAIAVAIIAGGLAALLHAWLSITFATDQIVSGTVINILAVGVTSFWRREFLLSTQAGTEKLPDLPIPILKDIPIVGDALFSGQPIFYTMFIIIIVSHIVLFYTRWGLRTRAVGEEPGAADTLGINVNGMRWRNVLIGGMIAGLAGAWFSLEATGSFNNGMTRGAGFIALAALIFGKWTPFGAFAGALLFGFSDALGTRFQIIGVPVPVQFLQMVPYIVTIIVLAGLVGRSLAPKAVGTPYKKD
ncbi:MAG: ABC transporter permease [Anaerolineae bacterium]|nr:ABC transporter permease [Anaerolineae bacterium]MCA9887689.1 ABC transporter permease [Anaerolineae bacterium]MCA9891881.1 ABC transporter permease [Anaerolineae bacterium]